MANTVKNPQIGFQGMFEKMDFAPVPYMEYPKMLYRGDGTVIGTAQNAMEERELLTGAGIATDKVDPIAALQAELAAAKAKLAQYEGPAETAKPAPAGVDIAKAVQAKIEEASKPSAAAPAAAPAATPAPQPPVGKMPDPPAAASKSGK